MKPDDRMRLASLGMVNRIADARAEMLHQISVLEKPEPEHLFPADSLPLCLTIEGKRLDAGLRALVRPVIIAELRARITSLDRDLEALGVHAA